MLIHFPALQAKEKSNLKSYRTKCYNVFGLIAYMKKTFYVFDNIFQSEIYRKFYEVN